MTILDDFQLFDENDIEFLELLSHQPETIEEAWDIEIEKDTIRRRQRSGNPNF